MKVIVRWRPLALWSIVLLGFILRLYGLNWDQGNSFHPDERQIMFHVTALAWPTSLAQFLDAQNSPLNPHFFAYGSFPMYLLAILGNILSHFWPNINSFTNLTLVGRVLSALFDSGTILFTGLLGLKLSDDTTPGRPHAWSLALLAAVLIAFTPLELQLSHFYAVDTMLLFFVTLTVYGCVVLVDTARPLAWALLIGIAYGLALGTKFSAAPLAAAVCVAALLRWRRKDLVSALASLPIAAATTILSFLIVEPYALLDTRNVVQQIAEQGDLARGLLDLPYVRQFAGTIPFVYEVRNMVFWGMGLLLGASAFVGLGWFVWKVWRRNAGLWLVVISWVLVYGALTGSFYVKFMRYMLPIYPFLTLMAVALFSAIMQYRWDTPFIKNRAWLVAVLRYGVPALVLIGTLFQGLALLNVYSTPNTRVLASQWMYTHIQPGSTLTYEQWDDPLPVPVGKYDPSLFQQLTYPDASGQQATGLDLYGDDTTEKAQLLAHLLPTVNVITMATDRLDKSIPRLPARYPLTIHYYQLLFSGQLGFHLAAQFENRPHLLGITLDDSNADESYSVFDHPHVRIFVRDTPYPYTEAQLLQKLLAGVQLPPAAMHLSGSQRSLMLSAQQIKDDQQSPPFGVQFPADSLSNAAPVLFWWLTLTLLSVFVYPLVFFPLRSFADRGYVFSKVIGILLLAYVSWLLAALHILAFSHLSVSVVFLLLGVLGVGVGFLQQRTIAAFVRQHWRLLLLCEGVFTLAYLLFVGIRSFNPDLWNPYLGGEKPMELAFLNAVLRSPYVPPLDPWFAGGYINYYYYGYVLFAALIKLTGIVPTTAFNLAIPTLFALTLSGAVSIGYSLTRRFSIALLAGYFAALVGNFDGLIQLKGQVLALTAHAQVPSYNYWQSSRIIPFTINEFPFWSFLFADLHPHVIDMPITVCMLGILAALLLSGKREQVLTAQERWEQRALYVCAAFLFGSIACINPWDMPLYVILLALTLLIQHLLQHGREPLFELAVSLAFRVVTIVLICGIGYLCYLPFYANYQQLYVNGLGRVQLGTTLTDFLIIFGLWIFLTASFFLAELFRVVGARRSNSTKTRVIKWPVSLGVVCAVVLALALSLGVKALLLALFVPGVVLCIRYLYLAIRNKPILAYAVQQWPQMRHPALTRPLALSTAYGAYMFETDEPVIVPSPGEAEAPVDGFQRHTHPVSSSSALAVERHFAQPSTIFLYLLVLSGLAICLGMELVYVRDFLDGGDYERMNTVFKFSIQVWFCFAIAGALIVDRLWGLMAGFVRRIWSVLLVALLLGCSVFLVEGTVARIDDHQLWIAAQPPAVSANYTPTLDGAAFIKSWYPEDAAGIAWLNAHVVGSPVILEAAAPVSYQWFSRVSVFTGLPDVLGWPDHVGEQRYDYQPANRLADVGLLYTTTDTAQALELLHYYHVRYIYVGPLEHQLYAQQSNAGLDKFAHMTDTIRVVYQAKGVTIYEVL